MSVATPPKMELRRLKKRRMRDKEVRTDARRRTAFIPSTISIASSPGIFVLSLRTKVPTVKAYYGEFA